MYALDTFSHTQTLYILCFVWTVHFWTASMRKNYNLQYQQSPHNANVKKTQNHYKIPLAGWHKRVQTEISQDS
jgi:hypothetical protein